MALINASATAGKRIVRNTTGFKPPPPIPEFEIFPGIIPHVSVVYVYPVFGGQHDILAQRFVTSYISTYSRVHHDLIVVCNGGDETVTMKRNFNRLKYRTLIHDDSGFDIGAYQLAARETKCDLMLFMGGSALFTRRGWMERIINAYHKHGDTLYGSMQNDGDLKRDVWPHIRTTGFWMPPKILNSYPKRIDKEEDRYPFEHGENCLTMWAVRRGLTPMVVTWDAEYDIKNWGLIQNGMHQGNQNGLIFRDRLTLPPYYPT